MGRYGTPATPDCRIELGSIQLRPSFEPGKYSVVIQAPCGLFPLPIKRGRKKDILPSFRKLKRSMKGRLGRELKSAILAHVTAELQAIGVD